MITSTFPSESTASPSTNSVELLPAEGKIVGTAKHEHDLKQLEVIGSWSDPNDCIKWSAKFPSPGIYDVVLVYSQADCKPAGSLMELAVGNQSQQARLQHPFNWDNPCYQYLGQVQIHKAGAMPVNLRVSKNGGSGS